jgi:hypothetical protein
MTDDIKAAAAAKTRKFLPTRIQSRLMKNERDMQDAEAYRIRCELEGKKYRKIQTFKDVVDTLEWATNSLISGARDTKVVSTVGYLMAIQCTALKLAKSEHDPDQQMSDRLKHDQLSLNMTPQEMKALLASTNLNVSIRILNTIADRPQVPDSEQTIGTVLTQDYLGLTQHDGFPSVVETTLRNAGCEERNLVKNNILEIQEIPIEEESEE